MFEIERGFFDEMVAHGLAGFPNESCGLLAGKEGRPVKFFRMTNAAASPSRYRFDSVQQNRVSNEMDDEGWDTLALFHTHTHSEAFPSDTDRKEAFWLGGKELAFPGVYYLIMSLSDREHPVLRGFQIAEDGSVKEEELVIP
jgi:proteasome lid subunit RPN8/RPN11